MKKRDLKKHLRSQIEYFEDKAAKTGLSGKENMNFRAHLLTWRILNITRDGLEPLAYLMEDGETLIQDPNVEMEKKEMDLPIIGLFEIPELIGRYEHENRQLAAFLSVTIERLEAVKHDIPFGFDERTEGDLLSFQIALNVLTAEPSAWLRPERNHNTFAFTVIPYDAAQEEDNFETRLVPLYQIADFYTLIRW
ncbi:TPA: hypothetical protein N6462_003039 [Escherichia coli]|nr:hypothetical protein [Escherichia coli]HCO0035828.1 hypothetical protein [Escherichia coli]